MGNGHLDLFVLEERRRGEGVEAMAWRRERGTVRTIFVLVGLGGCLRDRL